LLTHLDVAGNQIEQAAEIFRQVLQPAIQS
jgi:hypothetical protein